jgi:hypothetical protein
MNNLSVTKLKQKLSRENIYTSKQTTPTETIYTFRSSIVSAINRFFKGDYDCTKNSDNKNIKLFIDFANGKNEREDMKALNQYLGSL